MRAGEHRYDVVFNLIPDEEGEPMQDGATNVAVENGIDEWRLLQPCQYATELVEKLRAEPRALAFVPVLGICYIPRRGTTDVNVETQFRGAVA